MRLRLFFALVCYALLLPGIASGQGAPASASPSPPTPDPSQIIQYLSHAISWYRQLAVEQELATEPSDLTFLQENRRVATQVVQLAFDYARAQAQLQSRQPSSRLSPQASGPEQYQRLIQGAQKTEQLLQDTQSELQDARRKLASAPAPKRNAAESLVAELESEVSLLQARRDALEAMVEFVSSSSTGANGAGLRAQIEELARSVPASLSRAAENSAGEQTPEPSSSGNTPVRKTEPSGIWGLTANVGRLYGKLHSLDDEVSATKQLGQDAKEIQQPLLDWMRGLIRQGDQLFAAADTATPAQLADQKKQLDSLTGQFKQTTSQLLPLSKTTVLLDIYERTLTNWHEAVRDNLHEELRQLLLRLGVLALLIAVVLGIGEVWRKTTFRYVHDARRRYQFLLLRRVIMWIAVGLIIIFAFASQLGSAVTFAGLITAGVAVALQNVIVAVVAYFFLIGRYGIRVGDRVQIAGVTGEVVDIGLVRIHLMELGGPGESQPTGRVVAFSNSIVFQPTAGVFKQIPGTNFIWHELRLTLSGDTDYHAAKDRITQAVDAALAGYRDSIDLQRQMLERNLTVSRAELQPRVRLRYSAAGIEASVRFPVEMGRSAEMDDHVMKEVMAALEREPRMKVVSAEMPAPAAE